jgi:hypothetical protein
MVKERLEQDLRNTMNKRYKGGYYMLKLYNHPVTHQRTPGDFLILTNSNHYLVECKQCNNDRFEFSRLTQLNDLIKFEESLVNNYAYVLVMFYTGRLNTSSIFMLDLGYLSGFIKHSKKKSITKKIAEVIWDKYKVEVLPGGIFDLDSYI